MIKNSAPVFGLVILVFVIAQVGLFLGSGVLGHIEGKYWPASTELVVTGMRAGELEESTIFNGTFHVLRPNECSWRKFEWYIGNRNGRNVPVAIEHGKPMVRGGGLQEFEGWRVFTTPEQFLTSFADVYHDCGKPWLTKTPFYN